MIDASSVLKQDYTSRSEGQVIWYQEPWFEDGEIKGTFCHKECLLRAAYRGVVKEGMCEFCKSIEFIPSFRKRVIGRTECVEQQELQHDETKFRYLTRDTLLQKQRLCRENEGFLKGKIFLLTGNLK